MTPGAGTTRSTGRRRTLELLTHLTAREFRIRYQSALLGWVWSVAPPLARLVVLGFVFSVVFPNDDPDFLAHLAVGLLAWTWFSSSLSSITRSAVDRPELLAQPAVPRQAAPVVALLTDLLDYVAALPVVVLVVLVVTGGLPVTAVLLPVLLALQGSLVLGLGMAAAVADVRFRDVRRLVDLLLTVGFYATPVFYTLETVPASARDVLALNPMTQLIEAQRDVLVDGRWPALVPLGLTAAVCLAVGVAGWTLHRRCSGDFLDAL